MELHLELHWELLLNYILSFLDKIVLFAGTAGTGGSGGGHKVSDAYKCIAICLVLTTLPLHMMTIFLNDPDLNTTEAANDGRLNGVTGAQATGS